MVFTKISRLKSFFLCLSLVVFFNTAKAKNDAKKIDSTNVFFSVEYSLLQSFTSKVNTLPYSPSLGLAHPEPRELKPYYTTMILDITTWKRNQWNHLYGLNVSLDGKLQVYDKTLSRPFIANYGLTAFYEIPFKRKPFSACLLLNHLSNGQDEARSRSWNRLIFRLNYKPSSNSVFALNIHLPFDLKDNPDILQHYGLMSIKYVYKDQYNKIDAQIYSNVVNLNGGRCSFLYSRGFKDRHFRLTSRVFYGKSLVLLDYNHAQFEFSVGATINLPNKASKEKEWTSFGF